MAISTALNNLALPSSPSALLLSSLPILALSVLFYRAFFSQLASIPGPLICRFTSVWIWYHSYIGDECRTINALHARYGPVVRIAPNECSFSDGAALQPIYNERGGFRKADCYQNFDIEGHETIFSTRDSAHRAVRSKAIVPMFSMNKIRAGQDVIEACVERFMRRVRSEAEATKEPVNMLNLCRSLALDAVSSYLFGKPYGGIEEKNERLSASTFVDVLVAVGRFFFLPNWMFLAFELASERLYPVSDAASSGLKVDAFAEQLVRDASPEDETYQGRLKKAGISDTEIAIQCKDLIFAGTDSTGTNLSTLCWWLAKRPDVYKTLREEIAEADAKDSSGSYNPQTLKYLDAVVREGLRVSMANPTRFPRVVPAGGWTFVSSDGKTYQFPEGTMVGCQPYTLHYSPMVFPNPFTFKPERWLEASPEMHRDWMTFGLGQRQCIARNLAQFELQLAVRAIAREGLLEGATALGDEIKIMEWFNSKIIGEKIEVVWE